MVIPGLTIPAKGVSAWFVETDAAGARKWLASLPLADSAAAAREIYQALYTLNRQDLEAHKRFELMELYRGPAAAVSDSLTGQLIGAAFPLTPDKLRLAEFVRQLPMEMAHGYKCCLQDLPRVLLGRGRRRVRLESMERTLRYLGEALLRSYQVYLPAPAGVWKEIHALYRHAERGSGHLVSVGRGDGDARGGTTIQERYLQILLLGLSNPYQLPQGEAAQISRFLEHRAAGARLLQDLKISNPVGYFLVNLAADSPPVPFPRDGRIQPQPHLRALNVVELLQVLHSLIHRLQQGESARALDLGFECLESAAPDLLRRMIRSWGVTVRRAHTRLKRSGYLMLCAGVNAVHFFGGAQKPFSAAGHGDPDRPVAAPEMPGPDRHGDDGGAMTGSSPASVTDDDPLRQELYRIDRWQVRDVGPSGMLLAQSGESGTHVRVGDLLGFQRMTEPGRWSAGVARWLKSHTGGGLEMGVELLASSVRPVAVKPLAPRAAGDTRFVQALLLPAVEAAQRPPTLVVTRGLYQPGTDYQLLEDGLPPRRVRAQRLLERTHAFEQFVFADIEKT